MSDLPVAVTVTVNAIAFNGRIVLVDRKGRRIGRFTDPSRVVGRLDPGVLLAWQWKLAAQRAAVRFANRLALQDRNAWTKKAESLAASFKARGWGQHRERTGKTRLAPYSTPRWEDALNRLYHQIHNRYRKHRMTGWTRWSTTVANRFNKKRGCRYGKAFGSDGVPDHEADRKPVVQVCFEWAGTDAGNGVDRPHHSPLKRRRSRTG